MKNRYTIKKIVKDCLFPEGLYEIKDKETKFYLIMEDKKDVEKLKDYLITKDEQIRSLEEKLFLATSKNELKEHMPAYCTLAGRDCEYIGKIKSLEEQLKNSIKPKFKIGQEAYYYHIARNKVYSGVIEDIQWFAIRDGIYYRIPKLQRDYFWIREDELFATREDAENRLAELEGK